LKNYTGALKYLDKALAIDPNDTDSLTVKGVVFYDLKNYTESIRYYNKALAIDPNNVNALTNKGLVFDDLGNHTEAIRYYNKVLAIDPNNVDVLNNKGNTLDDLGNHTEAIRYYNKVLAIDPNNVDALTNKGNAFYSLGKYSNALIPYDKVLALNPYDIDALNNKANTLGKLGKNLEAIQYYKKAIKLLQSNHSSNVSAIYYNETPKAQSLYIFVSEDLGSSTQFIQAAASANSGQVQKIILIKLNLAYQYKSIKEFKLAVIAFTDILHEDPYNGCALLGRADALMKSGQPDQAAKDEKIGNMLKPTCSIGGANVQKPSQPSQPDIVATLAGALLH
jgi:tetratricopeptide (TPR) repeat protein